MKTPPGPRGRAALAFLRSGSVGGFTLYLQQVARRFGPVSGFRVLNTRVALIDEPELIGEILVRRQHEFTRDSGATVLRELVGTGMLTSEEPRHRERRRLIQPAFHRRLIAGYAATMAGEAIVTAERWSRLERIDAGFEMRRLTLAVVGSALFGDDLRDAAGDVADVLTRVIAKSAWLGPLTTLVEPAFLLFRRVAPRAPSLLFGSERRELERVIAPIIERRRRNSGDDMVSLLLAARDETGAALSNDDIRDEVVTMVLAGHETTAAALAWAWYLLAEHPAVAQRMRAEIDGVLGDRMPSLDDIARLPYTSAVVKETLRLYPSAVAFGRRPKADVELGGYRIPRGTSIFLSPYITQRNARWFPEPDAFRPERWETADPPKFAYFPFGGGAKMCIGEQFSVLEATIILATIGRRLDFERISPPVDAGDGPVMRREKPLVLRPIPRTARDARPLEAVR